MTVAELRAALAGLPADLPVCIRTVQLTTDYYCIPVDDVAVLDIVHDNGGGYDDPDDDLVPAIPTVILNDFFETKQ